MMSLDRTSKRNVGIEMLRIVSMFMIVFLHCFNVGGVLDAVENNSLNYYVSYFLFIASFVAVNLYGLTTGYVYAAAKHSYSKIISLWFEVFIVSSVIAVSMYFIPTCDVSVGNVFFSFFPLLTNRYWFFTAYFLLFLLIPLFNAGISNLSKNQYKIILLSLFVCICCFTVIGNMVGYFSRDTYFVHEGLSFIWLCVLYMFGAYIRLHGVQVKKIKCLLCYFMFIFLTFLSYLLSNKISAISDLIDGFTVLSYSFPFLFISSLFLFLFFANLSIKIKHTKLFLMFSSATFGVYIISTHPFILAEFQKDFFVNYANGNIFILVGYIFIYSVTQYISCIFITLLLRFLLKKVHAYMLLHKIYILFQKGITKLLRL